MNCCVRIWRPPNKKSCSQLLNNAHHILFTQDQILLAVDIDLGTRVFAEQYLVPFFDFQGTNLAIFQDFAIANGYITSPLSGFSVIVQGSLSRPEKFFPPPNA